MEKLDYDLHDLNKRLRKKEAIELDVTKGKTPEEEQTEGIEFSKRLLNTLEEKLHKHNSEYSKKCRLQQLTSVFSRGTEMHHNDSEHNITEWGLARVNLFLRISIGNIDDINLDINKKPSYNKLVDITDCFNPSEGDFKKAKSDIKDYDLNYLFEDVNELYINNDSSNSNLYFDY